MEFVSCSRHSEDLGQGPRETGRKAHTNQSCCKIIIKRPASLMGKD
jgi:hypothetical protein